MNFKKNLSLIMTVLLISACSQDEEAAMPAEEMSMEPESTLDRAIAALGGAQLLQNMDSFVISGSGNRYELDESPVPGGTDPRPEAFDWTINAANIGDDNIRIRIDITRDRAAGSHASTQIINGQLGMITGLDSQFSPAPSAMTSDRRAAILKEFYLLQPQAVLALAQENPARVQETPAVMNGMNFTVLTIPTGVGDISLYVAEDGMIPMASTPEYDFLRGDVILIADFSNWKVNGSGMTYPGAITLRSDGVVLHEETRRNMSLNNIQQTVTYDIPLELQGVFDQMLHEFGANSSEVYQNMASAGFPRSGLSTEVAAQEIAPGVFFIGGSSHNSLVVEQENGLVVIEAPLHYLRSQAVLQWIRENMPDKPVTHVVSTHHHTDHSAGARLYMDEGATLVAHEVARDFYADIYSRPHTRGNGAGALVPVNIETMPAEGCYTIEDAERAVTLYPLNSGGHANDMIMAYVEGAGVLFMSDTFSPNPNMTEVNGGAELLAGSIEDAGIEPAFLAGGHGAVMSGDAFRALFD